MHVPTIQVFYTSPEDSIKCVARMFFFRYQAGEPYGAVQKLGRKESYAASTVRVRQLLMV